MAAVRGGSPAVRAILDYPISATHSALIAELAIRHRLLTIGAFRYIVASGARRGRPRRRGDQMAVLFAAPH
jgi:hypothetical protein